MIYCECDQTHAGSERWARLCLRRSTAKMIELLWVFVAAFGPSRQAESCLLNSSDYCSSGRWTLNKWTCPRQRPSARTPLETLHYNPCLHFYAFSRIYFIAGIQRCELTDVCVSLDERVSGDVDAAVARSQALEWLLAVRWIRVSACLSPTGPWGGFRAQVLIGLQRQRLQPEP